MATVLKPILALLMAVSVQALAAESPRITYVGQGRSVCEGRSYECQRFEAEERARQQEREAQRRRVDEIRSQR
jgi:hypothetical protein